MGDQGEKNSSVDEIKAFLTEGFPETDATILKNRLDSLIVNGVVSLSPTSSSSNPLERSPSLLDDITPDERFKIVRSIGEECIKDAELMRLLKNKPEPIAYDGFEPSGGGCTLHRLTDAGCRVKILVAGVFARLNHKLSGDKENIRVAGKYFMEIWKAIGMKNLDKVEFVWSSDAINSRAAEYWDLVLDIVGSFSGERIKNCCAIMGRAENEDLNPGQLMYPCMQCADIFLLEADICQLGMDQRKVNMLAREYWTKIKKRKNKPRMLSQRTHNMLPGLKKGQEKMSKSDPSSAIFMEDNEDEVDKKINNAHCVEGTVEGNPCFEYIKHIIFPWFQEFEVERSEEHGGNKTFKNLEDLISDYQSKKLHPVDLKAALAKALNRILKPVRDHFNNDPEAKALLDKVKEYKVTK
ncbi:hypothetical protein MKW98_019417 [Papaver atlanticum]|uniref:tyrosine--tRNA ligase n=1 Tax=Papaver atlanticum TaxID=357466 RepID=A0AAD4S976_9MAGN|nr:hypothetical protein MKW98_019417 [Papaver atlanticum]